MNKEPDRKFLNRYFRSVYNKLEADALLFNRKIPHEGLKGSENEQALADVIRDFLPPRFGVEANALVIDRNGLVSRQCDIVIYESHKYPRYFRKVFPVELVYAVIEVKTMLTKQQVDSALENESSLRLLEYYPALTPYWQMQTAKENIHHAGPVYCTFGYRCETENFGTFAAWFDGFHSSSGEGYGQPHHSPFNHFIACCLDKGILFCRGDGHVPRWLTIADEKHGERNFPVIADGAKMEVDPAKALLFFLETLWTMLEQSPRHPGFDIRSYMDFELQSYVSITHDGKIEKR